MAATISRNKSPHIKEWMPQADPPREESTSDRINGRLQLLSSNKMIQYFKEWTTPSSVLEKIYQPYKNVML